MTRGLLRSLARGLIGVLLLAQLAVAAYACPGLAAKASDTATASTGVAMDASMPGCDDMVGAMDPESANLCAEHCKQGKQSDQASTLNVPVALLTALYETTPALPGKAPPRPTAASLSALVAASPPHTILHCVYRI
ncbi:hypothetical protein [Methylibium petroleiphilum]|uniref:hypothetical protein n=1 Tax=Methylibium petroleiphilum TaxID=105560 RepID=UPI001AD1E4FB|nr:hypothetical protein [Methylibium petroleiphilum]MBN9206161.1 hypothetical protein [Methylibium petroleiphilum]